MKKYILGVFLIFTLVNNVKSQIIPKSVPFLKKNGFYTLVKSGSKIPVLEKKFDNLRVLNSSLIIFQEDNKWGILDMNGNVKLNNDYVEINLIKQNIIELIHDDKSNHYVDTLMTVLKDSLINNYLYSKKESEVYSLPKEYYKYLIDTSGFTYTSSDNNQIITDPLGREVKGTWTVLYDDNKTRNFFMDCEVYIETDETDSNGRITTDKSGRPVKKRESLSSGILHISYGNKYISQYTYVKSLGLGLYSVSKNYKKEQLNFVEFSNSEESNVTYGIINGSGEKITPLKYNSIDPFSSGLSLVNNSGFINSKGDLVIPMTHNRKLGYYDGVTQENPNTIEVKFMDSTGKTSFHLKNLSLRYTGFNENWEDVTYGLKNFDQGLLFVNGVDPSKPLNSNKPNVPTGFEGICLIDNKGNIIKCGNWGEWKGSVEFPTLFFDEYSLTLNPETKKYGIINKKGRYVLNPKYDYVYRYCGEIVEIEDTEREYSLGEPPSYFVKYVSYILDPKYDYLTKKLIVNNLILVKQNDNIFYVDTNGIEYYEK